LAKSYPLTNKSIKAIYYPVDYSSTDLTHNAMSSGLDFKINGMCPIIANVQVPAGRNFNIEVCINYEVIPRHSESDLFSQGLSGISGGIFDRAINVFTNMIRTHGPSLLEKGV